MKNINTNKKNIDISKISIPLVRFKMKEIEFISWCDMHGFIGNASKLWRSKNNIEEKPIIEKQVKTK